MSTRRWATKADANQVAIVEALRMSGALVMSLGRVGVPGCPDLLVAARGFLFLVEVKRPPGKEGGKSEHGQHLNEAQEKFHKAWGSYIFVVTSPEEAVATLNGVAQVGQWTEG